MLEKIIESLPDKIEKSLKSSDLITLFQELEKIKNSTLICGVGGSHVVSIFLEKVLRSKNNIITKNVDVEEYFLNDFNHYENLIMVSHTGKNHGIKTLCQTHKRKYLFTTRKSSISNELTLRYSIIDSTKSFVSLDNTFIPLAILLCYYLNLYEFPFSILPPKNEYNIQDFKEVSIIYDASSLTCAHFLESSLVESGTSSVTMHTKYSFCHGRSNLISNSDSLVIYLMTKKSELDEKLIEEIPKISKSFLIIEDLHEDRIIADFRLTIKALYLLEYLTEKYNKEFVKVKYNKIVPTIYNFKGSLI